MTSDQDMFDQGMDGGGEGLDASRFAMWRTVVALAHADGLVAEEERHMIEGYLARVPFSEEQRNRINDDLDTPADPAALFEQIANPEDRGLFFQFARALAWSDGEDSLQEEAILRHLTKWQMQSVHAEDLERAMAQGQQDSIIKHIRDDRAVRAEAQEKLGLGKILGSISRKGIPFSPVLKDLRGRGGAGEEQ